LVSDRIFIHLALVSAETCERNGIVTVEAERLGSRA